MYLDNGGKKVGLAMILVGLMLVIIGFGKYFEESLKVATLTQNNIIDFKDYEMLQGEIKYKLPSEWIVSEKVSKNVEIIYCNEFISQDRNVYGSIEVLNGANGLDEVIEECIAEINNIGVEKYNKNHIKINNMNVSVIEYDIEFTNNTIKNSYEYYIPYENSMIVISFFVSKEKVRENTNVVFENIIKTFSFSN